MVAPFVFCVGFEKSRPLARARLKSQNFLKAVDLGERYGKAQVGIVWVQFVFGAGRVGGNDVYGGGVVPWASCADAVGRGTSLRCGDRGERAGVAHSSEVNQLQGWGGIFMRVHALERRAHTTL